MNRKVDTERLAKVRRGLAETGMDALVCRLPENVMYLSDYWAYFSPSFVVFPAVGEPTLIAPPDERLYWQHSWIEDVRLYTSPGLHVPLSANRDVAAKLAKVAQERGLKGKRIGYEGNFEFVANPFWGVEVHVPAATTATLLQEAFGGAELRDATQLLRQLRRAKTAYEREKLRTANEVALMGMRAAREALRPGLSWAELETIIEGAIRSQGIGYKGVVRARASSMVVSGVLSGGSPFDAVADHKIEQGELVLIELDTGVDGYWSDLTRVFTVGKPTARQQEIYDIVRRAQLAAIEAMKPGALSSEVDARARAVIRAAGYDYAHHTGHGIGMVAHEPPWVHAESTEVLEEGVVTSVEPGIYIQGWGGIRIEDDVAVTPKGGECLSASEYELG